jgi:hypothetical protein
MPDIRVPRGKRVKITQQAQEMPGLEGIDLILEEDLQLTLNSNFDSIIGSGANTGVVALGSFLRDVSGFGFSGQFKQFGFQQWKGTDPLSLSMTIGLYMKTNALKDVVRPAKELMKLPLPYEDEGSVGLVAPGPSILQAFGEDEENGTKTAGKRIRIRVGFVNLRNVIVKQAEPIFSNECDSNGYPIWAKIKLDVTTIFTATAGLIDEFGYNEGEEA